MMNPESSPEVNGHHDFEDVQITATTISTTERPPATLTLEPQSPTTLSSDDDIAVSSEDEDDLASAPNTSTLPAITTIRFRTNKLKMDAPHPEITDEMTDSQVHELLKKKFGVGQNFSSIVNNPREESSFLNSELFGDWFSGAQEKGVEPIVIKPAASPDIQLQHFETYLHDVYQPYRKFHSSQKVLKKVNAPKIKEIDPIKIITEEEGVPALFFTENFDLSNPDTFNKIFPPDTFSTSLLLQEKLTHYLDQVEVHILKQVNIQTTEAFDALMQYNKFSEDLADTLPQVQELRERIKHLKQITVEQPLDIARTMRRRTNLVRLYKKMESLAAVNQSKSTIDLLLSKGDYITALELIDTTKMVLSKELIGIQTFKSLSQEFREMVQSIKQSMENEFVQLTAKSKLTLKDLEEQSEAVQDLQTRLGSVVTGLIKLNHLQQALDVYRDSISRITLDKVKETIESCLGILRVSSSEGGQLPPVPTTGITSAHATMIKQLSHEHFMFLVTSLFESLYVVIKKTYFINNLIVEIGKDPAAQGTNIGAQLTKLLENVCESCHSRCAVIFSLREKEHKSLKREQLLEMMSKTYEFIKKCEALNNGKKISALNGTLMAGGQIYLDDFHKRQTEQIKLLVYNEAWIWEESVSNVFQQIVKSFIPPEAVPVTATVLQDIPATPTPTSTATSITPDPFDAPETATTTTTQIERSKYLDVNGELFPVSNSLLLLVKAISEYMELFNKEKYFFISAYDLASKLYRLLGLYNLEIMGAILETKATQRNILKTISAKHIALSSECLNCLIHIIPFVLRQIEGYLEPEQKQPIKANFQAVISDMTEHQNKLYEKVQTIMSDMQEKTIAQYLTLKWDSEAVKSPTDAMRGSIKIVITVQKILLTYLQTHPDLLKQVFTNVMIQCCKILEKATDLLNGKVTTQKGKQKLLADLNVFKRNVILKLSFMLESSFNQQRLEEKFKLVFGEVAAPTTTASASVTPATPATPATPPTIAAQPPSNGSPDTLQVPKQE